MKPFLFQSPTKVRFGVGASLELAALLAESGAKRPMIVSGTHVSKTAGFLRAKEALCREGYEPTLYLSAVPDPPIETVDEAAAFLRESGCDAVIAIGGGSSMPPYAWAVQAACGVPVFDFTTLIRWLHSSVTQKPYCGFL